MSYKVETINSCTKKFIFNFETIDLTQEIKKALLAKQKTVNLKGFRKGKAPLDMVQKFFGPQIENEALNGFIQTEFFNAVEAEKLRVVGYPSFENMNYDAGKSISFNAMVETFPEVKIKDMSKLSFKQTLDAVTNEDVDRMKNNYLASKAEMAPVAAGVALAKGHFAVMNFQGVKADGERPENMKGEEYQLEIGSGQFIPGFEDGMTGMKAGEKKDVNLTFPADYHVAELKDAKVKFEVELLEIKEKKYPEFSDELAKEFGFESVADFTNKTKANLEKSKKRASDEKLHQEILEKLIEENKFDVPHALVRQQEDYLKKDLANTLKAQGFNEGMMEEYFSKWHGDLNTKAQFQVRSGLILDTLGREFNIETNQADFDKKIEESAQAAGISADEVKKYYESDKKIKNNLMYAIREEKTFEKIKEIVKLS